MGAAWPWKLCLLPSWKVIDTGDQKAGFRCYHSGLDTSSQIPMVAPVFLAHPIGLSAVPHAYVQPNPKFRLSCEVGGRVCMASILLST